MGLGVSRRLWNIDWPRLKAAAGYSLRVDRSWSGERRRLACTCRRLAYNALVSHNLECLHGEAPCRTGDGACAPQRTSNLPLRIVIADAAITLPEPRNLSVL